MSDPTHGHHGGAPSTSADEVDMQKIITVGVVSLVIFALSALIAYLILRDHGAREEAAGRPPVPSQIGKAEIGIVDQVDFQVDRRLEEWKAAKRKRLTSYGWSDRSKGLIHIPIDKAIDEVVARAGAAPSGGQ